MVANEYLEKANAIVNEWLNEGYEYVTLPTHYSAPCAPHHEAPANIKSFDLMSPGGRAIATLWIAATLSTGVSYK